MAWPMKMVSRITSMFFLFRFEDNVHGLLFGDVKIKHMNFFPLEASDEAKEKQAILVAGELIKFMDSMLIDLEEDGDRSQAFGELINVLMNGEADSSEIVQVIDKHYKFSDEP